jgi:hypothetical protein
MMTVKAGRQLIEIIKLCYRANRPPLLIGRHGIGKSEILAQAAVELGIGYCCRDLSLMEPPDLIGLPKMDGATTRYLPPAFLPVAGKGLLVFEELNRCAPYMRAPCLQLLTARCLNDYQLPVGWLPCAAINPPEDADYEVQELDAALSSRFTRVAVVADSQEWLSWGEAKKLHPDVLGYVASDPKIFDDTNPRSWKYVSDLLFAAADKKPVDKDILEAAIAGEIGNNRAVAFRDFRRRGSRQMAPPKAAELLNRYGHHRQQVRDWRTVGRLDVLGTIANSIQLFLQPRDSYEFVRSDGKQWKALGELLLDLPADLSADIQKFMRGRGYDLPSRAVKQGRRQG